MQTHIKALGILHIVHGALGVLAALAILILVGGLAGGIAAVDKTAEPGLISMLVGGIGGLVVLAILLLSLPGLIGGIALVRFAPWSRIYMIVISALFLVHVPIGTAMGVYGIWVLTRPETEALLARPRVQAASSGY